MQLHLITAVHTDLSAHFEKTIESVARTRTRLAGAGVEILWHIVVDGDGQTIDKPEEAESFQATRRQIGASAARNLALCRAGKDGWVFRLDGDDTLNTEGWQALIADPGFGSTDWHPTNLTDQHDQKTPHWFTEPRLWGIREVEEKWTSPMAFHPNNIVVKTDLALEIGGWPALSVNEDILWCFTLNQTTPGLALPHVTLRYRRWEHQTVNNEHYAEDKENAFRFIESVVNKRRATKGLRPIKAPKAEGGALYKM